jgi:cytochrome b subunit of formate dehydrogenase
MIYRDLIQFVSDANSVRPEEAAPEPMRLLTARLVQKTPAQSAQVREHLARFAKFYGGMGERLDEFVPLFPIHPDSLAVLEKISFIPPPEILRWLADEVEKLLDAPVPVDQPGLIGYDRFWNHLRRQPLFQKVPEVEAVVYCAKTLEPAFEKSWTRPEWQPAGRKILHALFVQRLITGDIYDQHGVTPAELRDALCLPPPAVEKSAGEPSENLLALVEEILGELRSVAGEKSIFFHPHTRQYGVHIQKFKRFVKPEIALHWVNGLPFLALLLTGGAMLASRFWHFDRRQFVFVHEIFATAWIIGLPLTVLVHARIHWQLIRTVLTWRLDDFLWMTQSARSVINKKVTPPPAGRFNPGQKINTLLVAVYFFGFSATGLVMFFKGSILFPWYVHTALFFSALGSLGGHLHLALVNPSTRIALAGIFHGWAPIEYIKHHHPLSLPAAARSHHAQASKKSLKEELLLSKVEVVILIVTILLGGVGALAFNKAQLASIKNEFAKKFAASINPNDLSTRHRLGPLAESCTKCHDYTGEIPDANCEQCHVDIKDRRAKLTGYHGTFKGDCRNCHKEHPGATNSIIPPFREKFYHDLTSYKLAGKHTKLECDECHKKLHPPVDTSKPITGGIYYLGLKSEHCLDCHRDLHNGQFAAACEKCHTSNSWTGKELNFSHDKNSSFQLVGKHATVECVKCHKPNPPGAALGTAQFKGLSHDCTGCHEDPHRKQFKAGCETCHTTSSWKKETLKFDHNKDSKYPLVARHAEVACEKCHVPKSPTEPLASAEFIGLKTECADCHQDPHQGQFERNCTRCHPTPTHWTGKDLKFAHNQDSQFHLDGKHTTVECVKCHKPEPPGGKLSSAKFKGLGITCADCHQVKHPEEYGATCVSCHAIDRWIKTRPGVDHILKHEIHGEQLIEKHLSAKCSACHNPARLAVLGAPGRTQFECVTCHKANEDPHKGTLGADCSKCHRADAWKGPSLKFNHNTMTSYGLNQDHKNVACEKCHKDNHWKPLNTTCIGCHPNFTGGDINGKPAK